MEYIFLIGRVLFGGFFLVSGIKHFRNLGMMTGYSASKGVPMPKVAVALSGLLIILGGLGVILGVYAQYSLLAIIIFLALVTFKMHRFWAVSDPMQRMGEQINFSKNIALLGAALMMLLIALPWPLALTF